MATKDSIYKWQKEVERALEIDFKRIDQLVSMVPGFNHNFLSINLYGTKRHGQKLTKNSVGVNS